MPPIRNDILLWRNVPFGGATGAQDWIIIGENLTGAAFKMQIRFAPGDTATAGGLPITLSTASAGSQGVSVTYDAGYLNPSTGLAVGASIIRPQIDVGTIQAVSANADPTQPILAEYDLHVTPSGGVKQLYFYGKSPINPGVTI